MDATPHTTDVSPPDAAELWQRPETFATTLLILAADAIGEDLVAEDWDPDTVVREVESHWGQAPNGICVDKLLAALTILKTDLFYERDDVFRELCNVLSGAAFDPDTFDPADPWECAWGVVEASLIGPSHKKEVFSPAVGAYVRAVCTEWGVYNPPAVLAFGGRPDLPPPPDDPEDAQAFAAEAERLRQSIRAHVATHLRALFEELEGLELKNGSTADLVSKIGAELRRMAG